MAGGLVWRGDVCPYQRRANEVILVPVPRGPDGVRPMNLSRTLAMVAVLPVVGQTLRPSARMSTC